MRMVIHQRRPSLLLRLLWAAVIIACFALMVAIPSVVGYLYLAGRLP